MNQIVLCSNFLQKADESLSIIYVKSTLIYQKTKVPLKCKHSCVRNQCCNSFLELKQDQKKSFFTFLENIYVSCCQKKFNHFLNVCLTVSYRGTYFYKCDINVGNRCTCLNKRFPNLSIMRFLMISIRQMIS